MDRHLTHWKTEDGTRIERLRFYSYEELKKWCEDNMGSGISLYYGDIANMGDWYDVIDLYTDLDEDWFEFDYCVDIYVEVE